MLQKRWYSLLLWMGIGMSVGAQVVTVTPAYPTVDDSITITFDAAQGNAALTGVSPVFAHTGVLNHLATDPGDWAHVVSDWFSGFDSTILMTNTSGNLHQISFTPRTFYGIGQNEDVRALALVFRNQAGTLAGKNANGSDIYIPIFPDTSFSAIFGTPLVQASYFNQGDAIPVEVRSNAPADIAIFLDGTSVAQTTNANSHGVALTAGTPGKYWLSYAVTSGAVTLTDSIYYIVEAPVNVSNPPANTRDGINYLSPTSVVLTLQAPNKNDVYVIGDFNDWEVDPAYLMDKSTDGERHWIQLNGLTPGQEYRFQYLVNKQIRIGDPYAEKVLDPFHDNGINNFVYPNLIPYPDGKTEELVTVLQTDQPPYIWQANSFQRPDNRDLVIYELLVRDFVIRHDWSTVIDSLDYLKSLGINAIELMPFNEFDGNDSWGYGPAYFLAPDKYYGTKDKLKAFIDACHARGIAVIQDVVFNHAFGQNPMVRLYQDRFSLEVWNNNPWFNLTAPHPFGLGFDFNHDSQYTREFVDSVMSFWVSEYRIDGFRLDLSKGFTQTNTGQDIGAWSQYDAGRIFNLKRFATRLWQYHPGTYYILEHFADNSEETELANHGCMLWGKAHEPYSQATMGYEQNSDFSYNISYQARGWSFHNLVGFMESHDEERLMYQNLNFGNNAITAHDCRDRDIALQRMGQAAAFFFTVPGPKMIWQFGEYGYDYSINFGCRTCPKPITWFYLNDPVRHKLKKIYTALIKLKIDYPNTFRSSNYDIFAGGKTKQIHVNDNAMNATIIGNFDVVDQWTWTGFQHMGWWYDYFTGDSLNVTDVNMNIMLPPGDYRIFTDQRLPLPDLDVSFLIALEDLPRANATEVRVWPNPSAGQVNFTFELAEAGEMELSLYNLMGAKIATIQSGFLPAGTQTIPWKGGSYSAATYFWRLTAPGQNASGKIILGK